MTEPLRDRPGAPWAPNVERASFWFALAGGLPAVAVASYWLATGPLVFEARLTLGLLIVVAWLAAASAARRVAVKALSNIANLLAALREGDYSIRGLRAPADSSMALVTREVNDLGTTLQRQRSEARESTAILTHVMEEIAVAVFAFDPSNAVLLVNKTGAQLFVRPSSELVGLPASALGLDSYLTGEARQLVDRTFNGRRGRYEVRRAQFYRDGRPHQLLVMTDLSQALREEEQAAWQRIVRVLSHEINNSLTPIKSIAHSLSRIVERPAERTERAEDVRQGLALIEERSGALGRFIKSYAQLARLPKPHPAPVDVAALVARIVELESRLPVRVEPSPAVNLMGDSDLLEQLLINVVRNAVDASLETGGGVDIRWRAVGNWLELDVEDEGKGLGDTANLFVPFFTTKPNGSGIGLALSRQIAETHRGTLTLESRTPAGCRATLRLPL